MITLAGAVRCDGGAVSDDTTGRLRHVLAGRQRTSLLQIRSAVLVTGPATRRAVPALHRQPIELPDGTLLIGDVRLDEPQAVRSMLSLPPGSDDVGLVGAAVGRWGDDAWNRLIGDFAVARWEPDRRRLTLAIDMVGTRPLYHTRLEDGAIAFAGTLRTLLAMPGVSREIDDQDLACVLTRAPSEPERTLYRAIRRVPPGGMVRFDPEGIHETRYWTGAAIAPVRYRRDDDYVQAGRELLDKAVAARLPRSGGIAIMLSGGLDSTGIAATAARLMGDTRLAAFTRVPGIHGVSTGLDERALAGATAAMYRNIDWNVIDTDWIATRDAAPESESPLLAVPRFGAFGPTWFEPLLMAADRSDARVLLNGVMGNLTLSWAIPPEQRRDRSAIARLRWLRARLRRLRQRTEAGRRGPSDSWSAVAPVSRVFLDTLDFDAHIARVSGRQPRYTANNSLEGRLRFIQQQRPRDALSALRSTWGFEQLDPFTDRRLIEFTLGLPADQFRRGGVDRWLARRVLADRVPDAVVAATQLGMQQPEVVHMATRNRDAMAEQVERIARSPAAARVLDIAQMRATIDAWPDPSDTDDAAARLRMLVLRRGINVGSFLRWHEGGNA